MLICTQNSPCAIPSLEPDQEAAVQSPMDVQICLCRDISEAATIGQGHANGPTDRAVRRLTDTACIERCGNVKTARDRGATSALRILSRILASVVSDGNARVAVAHGPDRGCVLTTQAGHRVEPADRSLCPMTGHWARSSGQPRVGQKLPLDPTLSSGGSDA
jgi:hypothetical protein